MSQIAYLCEDMPPGVAQEATQAALQALVKVAFLPAPESRNPKPETRNLQP
jgi:hypothetical protein